MRSVSSLGPVVSVSGKVASLSSYSSVSFGVLNVENFASLFAGDSVMATTLTTTLGSASALVQGTVGSLSLNAASDAVLSGLRTIVSASVTGGQSALLFSAGSAMASFSRGEYSDMIGMFFKDWAGDTYGLC